MLGGLLLGFALYLSYGFVLVGLLALTVVLLRARDRLGVLLARARRRSRRSSPCSPCPGSGGWTATTWWSRRYYQGWAAERPYGYWVWANLAALLLSAGPVVGPALRRAVTAVPIRPPHRPLAAALGRRCGPGGPTVWLPIAAAVAVLAADLSGLSKAEVERIWLPFAVWLLVATAHLPAGHRRWWLAAQAAHRARRQPPTVDGVLTAAGSRISAVAKPATPSAKPIRAVNPSSPRGAGRVGDHVPYVGRPTATDHDRRRAAHRRGQLVREFADGVRLARADVHRDQRRPVAVWSGPAGWPRATSVTCTKSRRCRPSSRTRGACPAASADRKIDATPAYGVSRGIRGP